RRRAARVRGAAAAAGPGMDRPERLAAAPDRRAGGPGVRRHPHLADRRGLLRGRRGQEPPPGRVDHRRGNRVRAPADGRRRAPTQLTLGGGLLGRCAVGTALTCPTAHRPKRSPRQAFLIAEISNSSVTLSLTRTPPPSSAAFQVTP